MDSGRLGQASLRHCCVSQTRWTVDRQPASHANDFRRPCADTHSPTLGAIAGVFLYCRPRRPAPDDSNGPASRLLRDLRRLEFENLVAGVLCHGEQDDNQAAVVQPFAVQLGPRESKTPQGRSRGHSQGQTCFDRIITACHQVMPDGKVWTRCCTCACCRRDWTPNHHHQVVRLWPNCPNPNPGRHLSDLSGCFTPAYLQQCVCRPFNSCLARDSTCSCHPSSHSLQ